MKFDEWWNSLASPALPAPGYTDAVEKHIARMAWDAALCTRPEVERKEPWKYGDPERRKDNWTLITKEYTPKLDMQYKDRNGEVYSFFGIVHAADDYYYGLMDKDGKVRLSSCVGALDGEHGWYEGVPNGGRCSYCNCVFPISGPIKCDRYRCAQGDYPLESSLPQGESK